MHTFAQKPRANHDTESGKAARPARAFPTATAKATPTGLVIGRPGEASEREADRVAEQVMATEAPLEGTIASQRIGPFLGEPDQQTNSIPASVGQTLTNSGTPLEPTLRHEMERRFGHDFSRVRVHSGPTAERSARDVDANAYAVGHHIVFGAEAFASEGQPRRTLLAHELTHVLQQARAPSSRHSEILQRDPKDSDTKKKEPLKKKVNPKVEAAKKKLQDKFGIGNFTEEDGESWTETQLAKLDTAFSKMSPEEQESLKGVTLHRVKKIDRPDDMKTMDKKITIAAQTFPNFIQFTAGGFDRSTPIHEAGHLIRFKQFGEIAASSQAGIDEDALRKKIGGLVPSAVRADMTNVQKAAEALRDANDEKRAAKSHELDDAIDASTAFRMGPEVQTASDPKSVQAQYDALDKWVDAVRRVADEKGKIINEFISIVKANNLAKNGFLPFTKYVEFNWPKRPDEFMVECYAKWRNDPNYMKTHAKPLYEWFQNRGHLLPKQAAAKPTKP